MIGNGATIDAGGIGHGIIITGEILLEIKWKLKILLLKMDLLLIMEQV